jgi:hypothetical protein
MMSSNLIEVNLAWLQQALDLVEQLDNRIFATTPQGMAPHRVGSHLRHILEFYECFLDGLDTGRIDYDSRKRNEAVERDRRAAAAQFRTIIGRLRAVSSFSGGLSVRMENADVWLVSSIGRELQALSSHTIHHFALIAITLRLHGVEVSPDFGMSPSTLTYLATQAKKEAA